MIPKVRFVKSIRRAIYTREHPWVVRRIRVAPSTYYISSNLKTLYVNSLHANTRPLLEPLGGAWAIKKITNHSK